MSKIEDALNKLRGQSQPASSRRDSPRPSRGGSPLAGRSAIPIAGRKKIAVDGPKHHVSQNDLIQGGLLAPLDKAVPIADEFRKIKRPLIANAVKPHAEAGERMNVVMIASAMSGAGKTFCAVNLAVSISLERELNVLLVDADVAKPHISREFGLENEPGLIDLLVDESRDMSDFLVRTDLNDIQVLPAGRHHPEATELLASDRMSYIVRELADRYPDRLIIIDSPPLLITSEAQAIAGQVGQIALVVEAGVTSHQMVAQTIEMLDESKAINLLLNKTRHSSSFGGYYGGRYGFYGHDEVA